MTGRTLTDINNDLNRACFRRDTCRNRARQLFDGEEYTRANEWFKLAVDNARMMSDYEEEMTRQTGRRIPTAHRS